MFLLMNNKKNLASTLIFPLNNIHSHSIINIDDTRLLENTRVCVDIW